MAASVVLLYFSPRYISPRQNIIILLWKYLVDIGSEAWLNLFWQYINGKLFVVERRLRLGQVSGPALLEEGGRMAFTVL
jgi:hypothetical protein